MRASPTLFHSRRYCMLTLVPKPLGPLASNTSQEVQDHQSLVLSYLQSHRIRNHSDKTIAKEKAFLEGWFVSHSIKGHALLTWQAMTPVEGRKRVNDYSSALIETGIRPETIRAYLGILSRYFSYVLEHPYLFTSQGIRRIQEIYGPIDQPISEFDMPVHVYDGERRGIPLDPERLYDFYTHLRKYYLNSEGSYQSIRARNYTMFVLAAESGLRVDELLHLEISLDLFFESKKLQTRFAKGTRGSGKRARITLFTPLARDTVKFYLREHRPQILNSKETDYLFPSKIGKLMNYSSAYEALEEMLEVSRKTHFSVASHMSWHWARRYAVLRIMPSNFISMQTSQVKWRIFALYARHNHNAFRNDISWSSGRNRPGGIFINSVFFKISSFICRLASR